MKPQVDLFSFVFGGNRRHQEEISSKKRTNEFYSTTMKPQVNLFLFVFWRKLKTPKRHLEINWPLNIKIHHHHMIAPIRLWIFILRRSKLVIFFFSWHSKLTLKAICCHFLRICYRDFPQNTISSKKSS